MGELKKNVHLKGLSGQVNPELVYMQRAGKTFSTRQNIRFRIECGGR
jgi:hypothetical protein